MALVNGPLIVKDEVGTYCAKDIPCSTCHRQGTKNCPNGNGSKTLYLKDYQTL